jgi:hypothetical protein
MKPYKYIYIDCILLVLLLSSLGDNNNNSSSNNNGNTTGPSPVTPPYHSGMGMYKYHPQPLVAYYWGYHTDGIINRIGSYKHGKDHWWFQWNILGEHLRLKPWYFSNLYILV